MTAQKHCIAWVGLSRMEFFTQPPICPQNRSFSAGEGVFRRAMGGVRRILAFSDGKLASEDDSARFSDGKVSWERGNDLHRHPSLLVVASQPLLRLVPE